MERAALDTFFRDVLSRAWQLFRAEPLAFVAAGGLLAILSVLSLGVLLGPLLVGYVELIRKVERGQQVKATDIFVGFEQLWPSLIAVVIVLTMIIVGCALLFVPGVLAAVFSCYTLHAVAIEGSPAIPAITRSISLVREYFLETLLLLLLLSAISGLGAGSALGWLLTMPFSLIVLTVAYQTLSERDLSSGSTTVMTGQ